MINAQINTLVTGHVKAIYTDTNEVLIDKANAIHPRNMARVLARGLAHQSACWVDSMKLGNGGTHIDGSLNITFLTPNTTGVSAGLYNSTYAEVIDATSVSVGTGNSVISAPSPSPAITSVVTCTLMLDAAEPVGQSVSDGSITDPDSQYTFDELGLFTNDTPPLMISHLIFSPILKSANRSILITYTLTISVT